MSSDFSVFGKAVNGRYMALAKNELFVVNTDGFDPFQAYLDAYPPGTNPIFRTRTEHDCACCKNFVRNLGMVVGLDSDGRVQTVWDAPEGWLPEPYASVAKAMAAFVRSRPIKSVYRTKEHRYGAEKNHESLTEGGVRVWHHFWGDVQKRHLSSTPDKARGELNTTAQVFQRGLEELSPAAVEQVLDLIESNALYRGKEHKKAVVEFEALQKQFLALDPMGRTNFAWTRLDSKAARFRNTVIGTLVQDLSEGKDLEFAVKAFETKVAPQNYKRPTALITPKMIEQAVDKLKELGLEDAVHRRHARIEDVSVNDVLWVDNAVRAKMKGGLADLLMEAAAPTREFDPKKAKEVTIEEFMALRPKSVELVLDNNQRSNFVSLTAPQHADSGRLFKWGNDFAWSYDGEVADSMREAVVARGGSVTGVFRFTHQWNYDKRNASLMDLHVFMPGTQSDNHTDGCHDRYPTNRRVGWNSRNDHVSGGKQDVDYVEQAPVGYVPVENITFPDLKKMPEGTYICKVHNWQLRSPTEGGFKAEIEFDGQIFKYEVQRPLKHKEWVTVAKVSLRAGKFSIEHVLKPDSAPQGKWGVQTKVPVAVDTIMLSPNHWDGAGSVGNKHWFFILKGCKNPDPTRGIYNEFLNGALDPHRKVFEVLGTKTKVEPADSQLSGVGFSSTRKDKVFALANGRPYIINF